MQEMIAIKSADGVIVQADKGISNMILVIKDFLASKALYLNPNRSWLCNANKLAQYFGKRSSNNHGVLQASQLY